MIGVEVWERASRVQAKAEDLTQDEMAALWAIQCEYDALVRYFHANDVMLFWRQSSAAQALHARIVRILRGHEPDPRTVGPDVAQP